MLNTVVRNRNADGTGADRLIRTIHVAIIQYKKKYLEMNKFFL